MRHNTKTIERASGQVASIHLELRASLNKRLEEFVEEYKMSKRQIIETALFIWMNERDKEAQKDKK